MWHLVNLGTLDKTLSSSYDEDTILQVTTPSMARTLERQKLGVYKDDDLTLLQRQQRTDRQPSCSLGSRS